MQHKKLSFLILIVMLSACSLSKKGTTTKTQSPSNKKDLKYFTKENVYNSLNLEDTRKIITTLASDKFGGRKPGENGFELSVDFAEKTMQANGIRPFYGNSYKDSLTVRGNSTYNLVGLIGEKTDKKYILIGAHLDHIGIKNNKTGDNICNGANDNASGSTAVLQVSKVLAEYAFDRPVIVVLFTAEEMGLMGSKHLAKRFKKEGVEIEAVFNFEMIGKTLTTGADQVYITGYKKSNLAKEMNDIAGKKFVQFLPAEIQYQLFSRSDNFPFYAEFKIPSHTISTFDFKNYDHYHKVTDETELLDIENMHTIIQHSSWIIGELMKQDRIGNIKK